MARPTSKITSGLRMIGLGLLLQASLAGPGVAEEIRDHARVQEALTLLQVWLEAKRDYRSIPGLSVAVVHNQELLWSGGYGMADPGRGIDASSDTIYGICSISKLFTGIAVMQLRDAGLLRLDDPVSRWLPEFSVDQIYEDSADITIEGLLTHTSGLRSEVDTPPRTGADYRFPTREEMMRLQAGQETLFPASTAFEYSNLGISLAGEIVARVSGTSFEDYIRSRIIAPLGLESTWTQLPQEEIGTRMAIGYSARNRDGARMEVPPYQGRGFTPAAGLASTARDLAAFASWQFRLLDGGGDRILAASTLRDMYRPHFIFSGWQAAWGLGFEIENKDGRIYVGHSGTCPGYTTRIVLEPESRTAVVVLANASHVDVWNLASMMHKVMAPAIETAMTAAADAGPDGEEEGKTPVLSDYTGLYDFSPWNVDNAIILWGGGLAAVRLGGDDPMQGLRRLQHIDGDVFRRIRWDGLLAESWTFERDPSGKVMRYRIDGYHIPKIR